MKEIIKELVSALNAAGKNKTSPYDVKGKVKRIEGKIAWVQLNGGIDETPVERTINCKPGDTVQVRVSGGNAWITGNASAPPTDDTVANKALNSARSAMGAAGAAQEGVDKINDIIEGGELTVVKVVIEHILSTSRSQLIPYNDMAWSETLPTYVSGCFYWIRTATYYADGTVKYSTPVYDMASQVSAEANIAAENAAQAAEDAAGIAEDALEVAGTKRRVFNSTPTTPYDKGDLWFDGVHGNTYICTTSKASGSFNSSHWTLYSTDVSQHFWYDSSGAHIAENAGDVSTGASQTIASAGTVIMRNGKLVTSWTGSSYSNAALNFYDCSNATASTSDLVASYARAGITMYINNISTMALTASGLSFYSPDSNHYTEAIFGSAGVQLFADGIKRSEVSTNGLKVYDTSSPQKTIASFGPTITLGDIDSKNVLIDSDGMRIRYGSTTYASFTPNSISFKGMWGEGLDEAHFSYATNRGTNPHYFINTVTASNTITIPTMISDYGYSTPISLDLTIRTTSSGTTTNKKYYDLFTFQTGGTGIADETKTLNHNGITITARGWGTHIYLTLPSGYKVDSVYIGSERHLSTPEVFIGESLQANGIGHSLVLGQFNTAVSQGLLTIGNGVGNNRRSNAFSVDWDGNVKNAGSIIADSYISAGKWTANTAQSNEYQVRCLGGSGAIYLYSQATTSGSRGIYSYNAAGTYQQILSVNQSGGITIPGVSDERLKANINTLEDKIAQFLLSLRPVSFEWKTDSDINIGFVAQEVEASMEALGVDSDEYAFIFKPNQDREYYALNYTEFIPMLVHLCQKQQKEIDELKLQMDILKTA